MRDPSVIRQAAQDHAELRWLSETATRVSQSGPPPGEHQDRWSLEFLLADVVFGHDIQKTIDAPVFNTSHFP